MSIGLTIKPQQKHEILIDLCNRSQPAEFILQRSDRDELRSNVRFLELTDQAICLDLPTDGGQPISLRSGEPITLEFTWQDQRLTFDAQMIERTRWSDGQLEAMAILVTIPSQISKAQRRNCYRLSVMHLPETPVLFMRLDRQGKPFKGMLVDLSETGARILIDKNDVCGITPGDLYIASFRLPGREEGLALVSEIRWLQEQPDSDRTSIGVQWQLEPSIPEARRVQQTFGRFIATEQTLALRRQRESQSD